VYESIRAKIDRGTLAYSGAAGRAFGETYLYATEVEAGRKKVMPPTTGGKDREKDGPRPSPPWREACSPRPASNSYGAAVQLVSVKAEAEQAFKERSGN